MIQDDIDEVPGITRYASCGHRRIILARQA
jgi:hypothetical protein